MFLSMLTTTKTKEENHGDFRIVFSHLLSKLTKPVGHFGEYTTWSTDQSEIHAVSSVVINKQREVETLHLIVAFDSKTSYNHKLWPERELSRCGMSLHCAAAGLGCCFLALTHCPFSFCHLMREARLKVQSVSGGTTLWAAVAVPVSDCDVLRLEKKKKMNEMVKDKISRNESQLSSNHHKLQPQKVP